jgi:protein SCO1
MKLFLLLGSMLAAGLLAGCGDKPSPPTSAESTNPPISGSPDVQFYLVRGVLKKVDAEAKTATIQHEEIPNYMEAMTMPFKVKDPVELEKLQALQSGDTIWFRLWVAPEESWIDKIVKQQGESAPSTNGPAAARGAPQREAVRVVRDVEPLKEGDVLPNYTFTNELGRRINLSDYKGQALAFTFIFTRCPLPDFCPRMSRNFLETYQKLKAMPNAPTNWHLLSISFDPHFDTPEVLRSYGHAFQYDPARWSFVTGAMIDIDSITDQFELIIVKRGEEWDHKLRTVVIDAAGRVQKIIYGNDWKPEALVQEIVKAAGAKEPTAASAHPSTR